MFVLAEIPTSFLYYAGNFSYYAGIMLYAFDPLLCLKLYQHNRLKPMYDIGMTSGFWNLIRSHILHNTM